MPNRYDEVSDLETRGPISGPESESEGSRSGRGELGRGKEERRGEEGDRPAFVIHRGVGKGRSTVILSATTDPVSGPRRAPSPIPFTLAPLTSPPTGSLSPPRISIPVDLQVPTPFSPPSYRFPHKSPPRGGSSELAFIACLSLVSLTLPVGLPRGPHLFLIVENLLSPVPNPLPEGRRKSCLASTPP